MLAKLNTILTPARRKAIYGLITAAVAAAIAFNILTADEIGGTAEAILSVLTAITTLMAFFNTSSGPADGS